MPSSKKSAAQLEREISSTLTLKPPRLKRLGFINGLVIYLVSGEQVRNKTDIDFTAGGSEAAITRFTIAGFCDTVFTN